MYLHADLASGKKFKMISGDQFPVCFVVYKVISYLQNKKREANVFLSTIILFSLLYPEFLETSEKKCCNYFLKFDM